MGTYTQILYQIVFSTKYRQKVLLKPHREKIYAYMSGILRNKKCRPYIINGIEDHVHIITHIHPTVNLSSLIKSIKISSHEYIDKNHLVHNFPGWQNGYGAFTYSQEALQNLVRYVENQEVHHHGIVFETEFITMQDEHEIGYDPQYVFD